MKNYGCYNRLPHDYLTEYENPDVKGERCRLCNHQIQFKKDLVGRVDNKAYLEAHIRNFAQRWGPTAQIFYACHKPELYNQFRSLWAISLCLDDECMRSGKCRHGEIQTYEHVDYTKAGTNGQKQEEVNFYANNKAAGHI